MERKAFIGFPVSGHSGYALNVPISSGWIVERFDRPENCILRAAMLGIQIRKKDLSRIAYQVAPAQVQILG